MTGRRRHKTEIENLTRNPGDINVEDAGQKLDRRKSLHSSQSLSNTSSSCNDVNRTEDIHFFKGKSRNILRGQSLGEFGNGFHRYAGMDKSSGELLTVVKCVVKMTGKSRQNFLKCNQMHQEISQQFLKLQSLHNSNLCHYLHWSEIQCSDVHNIYVLMEYYDEVSFSSIVSRCQTLSIDTVRTYTSELLKALYYLHENGVAHGNIDLFNIFIDKNGVVRLAGFDIFHRLSEFMSMINSDELSLPAKMDWNIQSAKRNDLYQLGIIVQKLANGISTSSVCPDHLDDLKDFLNICLNVNVNLEVKTLLDHPFIQEWTSLVLRESSLNKSVDNDLESCEDDSMENVSAQKGVCSQSRFKSGFKIIEQLGEGGCGSVYKAKHVLDGQIYAVKKIYPDPDFKIDKKFIREARLLSTLNHKNIVRYHDSWIEKDDENISKSSSTLSNEVSISETLPQLSSIDFSKELDFFETDVDNEPQEWQTFEEDQMDDQEGKEVDGSCPRDLQVSPRSYIVAHTDSQAQALMCYEQKEILYIQMECCEGRTLRNVIDEGLSKNLDKVLSLLQEILEGLEHLQEKHIIHRDLKPVNIFLDSSGQVKIGDFGLARKGLISKQMRLTTSAQMEANTGSDSGSLTKDLGTSFYVSPEVKYGNHYDEKADMYSLGIILFEMCHRTFPTQQERSIVLGDLRQPSIEFPQDFEGSEKMKEIIRRLLNHNPHLRPTAKQMLDSYFSPPSPIVKAEQKLSDMLLCSLIQPHSTDYNFVLQKLFSQEMTEDQKLNLDNHMYEKQMHPEGSILYQNFKSDLLKMFSKFGAVNIPVPLLLPKCDAVYDDKHVVQLINSRGGVFTLPYDHRVAFARYISKNDIHFMRRFTLEKVFRENVKENFSKIVHPIETTECAFDIISRDNRIPDAEVLCIVQKIINILNEKLQSLRLEKIKILIEVNNILLLKAILLHYGIMENDHNKVLMALCENRTRSARKKALQHVLSEHLSQELLSKLLNDLDIRGSKTYVRAMLKHILEPASETSMQAKAALKDMESVANFASILGLTTQITYCLNLVLNPNVYSSFVFQVLHKTFKNCQPVREILAMGGRYDNMLENLAASRFPPRGVGVSLQLEKLALILMKHQSMIKLYDVMICLCTSNLSIIKKSLAITKTLRNAGFNTIVHTAEEELSNELLKSLGNLNVHIIVVIRKEFPTVDVFLFKPLQTAHAEMNIQDLENFVRLHLSERSRSVTY